MESKSSTYVIILAAGYATRLRPLSEKIPKPLIDICGKTLISRIISNFKEAGFTKFCIVLGYKDDMIKYEISKHKDIDLLFVNQGAPKGMADAIALGINSILRETKHVVNFFITAADVIFPRQELLRMDTLHQYSDIVLSLMKSNDLEITKGHANVNLIEDIDLINDIDENQGLKIIDIIEKPKPSEIMSEYYSLPLYLTNNKILKYLKKIEISKRGEKEFQDILRIALQNGEDIRGLRIVPQLITRENIGEFHLTSLRDIIIMNKKYLTKSKVKKSKFIEPLRLGSDVRIGDKSKLGPYLIIGNSSKIGDFSELSNTILFDKVSIGKYCILKWCIIDEGVSLPDKYYARNSFITQDNKNQLEIINF